MSKNKSYEELFMERLQKESEEFQKEVAKNCKNTKYIFANAQEIYLKAMFIGRLAESEEDEETYKQWLKKEGNILEGLYERYRDNSQVIESEEFYSDQVIEEYFELEEVEEVEDADYKQLAIDKLTEEYEDFKRQATDSSKTAVDVFNASYENYVKTELYFLFMNHDVEFDDSLYYALAQEQENVLHEMYEYYSEDENAGLNSLGEAKEFVEKILLSYVLGYYGGV